MDDDVQYEWFMAAFNHLLGNKWGGSQKRLHIDTGISEPSISQVRSRARNASVRSQIKIAKAFGYSFDGFLALGRSLFETGKPTEAPTPIPSEPQKPGNRNGVYQLFKDGQLTQEETRRKKMHDHLKIILDSGDSDLVMAIESNLISFRKTVELQNQVKILGKKMGAMAAQIKDLKRK